MKKADPLFSYLTILAVIQPARIQDIESSAASFLGSELARWFQENDLLKEAHTTARTRGLVLPVRRGVYFLTTEGKQIVRRQGLEHSIDNRRLFLMKEQRRRYK